MGCKYSIFNYDKINAQFLITFLIIIENDYQEKNRLGVTNYNNCNAVFSPKPKCGE